MSLARLLRLPALPARCASSWVSDSSRRLAPSSLPPASPAPAASPLCVACALLVAAAGFGCAAPMPAKLADGTGRLAPCPASPNCVSSEARDARHAIAALAIRGDVDACWSGLVARLEATPRVELVRREDDYLHAVFTSRLMRYRDDVEFALDRTARLIRVRSASRIGYGDMGANRARIEAIRRALADAGLVEPAP